MLTERQQNIFNDLLTAVEQKRFVGLSSHQRGIGKTTILNELAFTLQALGYVVYLLTPYKNQEYFAHKFISNNTNDLRGVRGNIVVIADEARYCMMDDLFTYCRLYGIPVVGFINYDTPKEVKSNFKQEYESKWI